MRKLSSARPSPAMVVAVIALIAALGGGAYAAISVPKKSVGPKQLKANAVTEPKIKSDAVTEPKIKADAVTAPKVKDGAIGAAELAGDVRPMWAHVSAAGAILSQSGGITIDPVGTPGAYLLHFPRSTRGTALLASLNQPGGAGGGDADNIEVQRFGSGPGEGTGLTPNDVVVHTRNAAAAFEPENFTVVALP